MLPPLLQLMRRLAGPLALLPLLSLFQLLLLPPPLLLLQLRSLLRSLLLPLQLDILLLLAFPPS